MSTLAGGSIFGSLTLLTLFFNVPDTIFTEDYRIAYYMSAIVLSSMSFPALSIPHQALATEISSDYDQALAHGCPSLKDC